MPITAPIKPIITDSPRKMVSTVLLFMPNALRMPISRVRSISETIMMFIIPMPATSSEIAAIPPRNNCRMLKMFVSKLSTAVAGYDGYLVAEVVSYSFGNVGDCCVVAAFELNNYHVALVVFQRSSGLCQWECKRLCLMVHRCRSRRFFEVHLKHQRCKFRLLGVEPLRLSM